MFLFSFSISVWGKYLALCCFCHLSLFPLNRNFSLAFSCLLHLPLFLNQQPRSLLSTCVMRCRVGLCYHHFFLFITFLVVLVIQCTLQLSLSEPASTACWRLAQWVGGSCMRGTLWAACCGLCPPLNPCSVSLHSLHFSFFLPFSPSSCSEGKSYGVVYLFWFGVGSHMSLAGFHTTMTVAWIVRDYHVHMGVPLAVCINASAIVLA